MAIFRLHIPVLDEVKRKGLRTALNDKWVDVVTRVTAGLNPADVRGVPPSLLPKYLVEDRRVVGWYEPQPAT